MRVLEAVAALAAAEASSNRAAIAAAEQALEAAKAKAETEYEKFRGLEAAKPSPVEIDFQATIEQVKQLKKPRKKKP